MYHLPEGFYRDDGVYVDTDDHTEWWENGQIHRIGGPAVIFKDRTKEWREQGILHRIDGPAVEHFDGRISWYVNGQNVTSEVENWMHEKNYFYPFDEKVQFEFLLRF